MRNVWIGLTAAILCLSDGILLGQTTLMPVTSDLPLGLEAFGSAGSQVSVLDSLVDVTQQTLEATKKLQAMVSDYSKLQGTYLQDPSDKDRCYQMVKSAHRIIEHIEASGLEQVFDDVFLGELSFFAQMAKKKGIPQP